MNQCPKCLKGNQCRSPGGEGCWANNKTLTRSYSIAQINHFYCTPVTILDNLMEVPSILQVWRFSNQQGQLADRPHLDLQGCQCLQAHLTAWMQFFSESSSLSFHSSFLEGQVPSGFCQVQQSLQSERLNEYETIEYMVHEFIYLYVSISVK